MHWYTLVCTFKIFFVSIWMCMCMHKALGGHSFDALLEASSDLITHFGLLEDYGSFARLLKQFLKILLGIFPIKWGYLGTQMACQGYFSTCRSCFRSFYSEIMPHDFFRGWCFGHESLFHKRQVVGMGVSFVNWKLPRYLITSRKPIKCCSKETHMPAFVRLSLLATQGVMSLDSIAWFACVGSLSRQSSGVGVQDTLRIHMGIPKYISHISNISTFF